MRHVRWLFLRSLGVVNWIAFRSLRRQVRGLYGKRGILPLSPALQSAAKEMGPRKWAVAPSVLWLGASDKSLDQACAAGEVASVALALNVLPRASAMACWWLYRSFLELGEDFMGFQWDSLLLEANLHGFAIAPPGWRPGLGREPTPLSVATMRAMVARLYFESGWAKVRGGDRTWRTFTSLAYYYETAPLPTKPGWYAHHLPIRFQQLSTAGALALEIVPPLFSFGPRRARLAAFGLVTLLQAAIALTGNYGFFNLLSAVLGLWLLDDEALGFRSRVRPRRVGFEDLLCVPLLVFTAAELLSRTQRGALLRRIARFGMRHRLVSPYGLFTAMTTARPEIVIEGSNDGREWRPYRFRFKPDDPQKPPRFNAPHQPRLDWQMWFAALTYPPRWFRGFLGRLLEGSPEVLELLDENPFPDRPPRYVRARLYDYRMTSLDEHRESGRWWRRVLRGDFFPTVALRPACAIFRFPRSARSVGVHRRDETFALSAGAAPSGSLERCWHTRCSVAARRTTWISAGDRWWWKRRSQCRCRWR